MRIAIALPLVMVMSTVVVSGPTYASPVGIGAGTFTSTLSDPDTAVLSGTFTFDNVTEDVFGTPVNLGTAVGSMSFSGVASLVGLSFSSSVQSTPDPSFLSFDAAGFFTFEPNSSGPFVGDVTNIMGSVPLPGGLSYTVDGFFTSIFGGFFLDVGLNAFEPVNTPVGSPDSPVTIDAETTFYNPVTGTEVSVSVQVTYAEVTGEGTTLVTAVSNAAGELPSNFAIETDGYRAFFFDVSTDALVSGPIVICAGYPDDSPADGTVDGTQIDECTLRILHKEGDTFVDRTLKAQADACSVPPPARCPVPPAPAPCIDTQQNVICAEVDNLSLFVISVDLSPNPTPQLKGQQKCINNLNKGARKMMKAVGGNITGCLKAIAKGDRAQDEMGQCATEDPKGKRAKAQAKLDDKAGSGGGCDGANAPDFGFTDPNTAGQASIDKELQLLRAIFGSDLDSGVIVTKEDDKDGTKCQQAVWKAVQKCQDTKIKLFGACKKNQLKGKNLSSTPITSALELQEACLQTDPNDPTTGIPDPKGKLPAKCIGGIQKAIDKKCVGLDTAALFPGCEGPVSVACLDPLVECGVCKALNEIDGLNRACDLFDDGLANGSCTTCGDGFLDVDEECDDGNLVDDDGCDALCQLCDPTDPGSYTLAASLIINTCGGLVNVSTPTLEFQDLGGGTLGVPVDAGLTVGTVTLKGPMPTCPSGNFTVTDNLNIFGCCGISTLTGDYTGVDSWTGTWTTTFCDTAPCCPGGVLGNCGLGGCVGSGSIALSGTR